MSCCVVLQRYRGGVSVFWSSSRVQEGYWPIAIGYVVVSKFWKKSEFVSGEVYVYGRGILDAADVEVEKAIRDTKIALACTQANGE